ncbi:flagellar hook assembly protein FlgD [Legionella worsleiensis]|uniref:Basal-body rod modification protein FlgD n=1 Tax=Legionella worsleiensis TaxID=45076 RepID=A0A0W1A606_9GAMM|nr:flagellar hook capping FlgD N-terminal domain-containing protein [Legionella worsleiensis]KTD76781.1 flagellar basal body rod modification protein [Legionella worsleiensis]STY30604.1 flagellar basal body rod modification protein [Legionella worsleiensis]
MTEPVSATGVDESNYLKLFMQELTYQDPLKPVDNREFMAQMAQFSALQEARTTNAYLKTLLGITSGTLSLELLGKQVRVKNIQGVGRVNKVEFHSDSPPLVSVAMSSGEVPKVELGDITEVMEKK